MAKQVNLNNNIVDPSQVGTQGLKGINTIPTDLYKGNYVLEENRLLLESPVLYMGKVGLNDSSYDADITSASLLDNLQDTRADLQPWYSQLASGIGKMGVLAGTTFLNSTLGLATGSAQFLSEGVTGQGFDVSNIWDNKLNHALKAVNEWSEEALPNYYSQQELDAPWYSNMGTANFWGDKVLKNFGFTIGAIGAGMLTGNALSSISWLANAGNAGKIATLVISSTVSAAGEASIEAINAADDFSKLNNLNILNAHQQELGDLDNKYINRLQDLEAKYAGKNSPTVALDEQGRPLTQRDFDIQSLLSLYEAEKSLIDGRRSARESQVEKSRDAVGNMTFGLNMLILSASNNAQFGRLLQGGFNNARRGSNLIARVAGKTIESAEEAGKGLASGTLEYAARTGKGWTIARNAIKNSLSEGAEEGLQNVASNTALMKSSLDINTFAGAKINPEVQDLVNDYLSAGLEVLNELFGGVDAPGWEEVFIGGLTGLLGVPFFKKGANGGIRPTWQGGIKEAIEDANQEYASNKYVDALNQIVQNPDFINRYLGMIRHNHYLDQMDLNLAEGKEFEYSNNEHNLFINDVLTFNNAGTIDDFKNFLGLYSEVSDEDVLSIKEATKMEGSTKSIYDGMTGSEIKEEVANNAKRFNDKVDSIINFHNYHLTKFGDVLNEELAQELTYMASKIEDWNERGQRYLDNLKPLLNPILELIEADVRKGKYAPEVAGSLERAFTSPRAFLREVTNEETKLGDIINNALNSNLELIEKGTAKIEALERLLNSMTGTTEKDMRTRSIINNHITNEYNKIAALKDARVLRNAMDIKDNIYGVTEATRASDIYSIKYANAIANPKSLIREIETDTEKASENKEEIEEIKDLNKVEGALNFEEFKAGAATLDPNKRKKLLRLLSKVDSPLGRMAKDLKEIDDAGNEVTNLLDTDAFEHLSSEEKLDMTNTLSDMLTNASSYDDLLNRLKLQGETNEEFKKISNILENANKEKKSYQASSDKNNKKPSRASQQFAGNIFDADEFGEPEDLNTDSANNPVDKAAPVNNKKEEKSPSIDTTNIDNEDFTKAMSLDEDIDPTERNAHLERYRKAVLFFNGENKREDLPSDMTDQELNYWNNKYKETLSVPDIAVKELTPLENMRSVTAYNDTAPSSPESALTNDAITEASIGDMNNGHFVPFAEKNPAYKVLWDYLNNEGAFDFVNQGYLQSLVSENPNLPIRFIVDRNLNNTDINGSKPLATTVFLGILSGTEYLILGALKPNSDTSKNIINKVINDSVQSDEDIYISDMFTTVNKIFPGRIATSTSTSPMVNKDVTLDDANLAIAFNDNVLYAPTINDGEKMLPNTTNNAGRVYLMLPAANGKYIPTPVGVKRFNDKEYPASLYGNTPIYQLITEAINTIVDTSAPRSERLFARDRLEQAIYFGNRVGERRSEGPNYLLHWIQANDKEFIQISRITYDEDGVKNYEVVTTGSGVFEKENTVTLTGDILQDSNNVLELIKSMDLRMQVVSRFLNDLVYTSSLINSGVLTTNLADYQVHNANFSINPIDTNGNVITSKDLPVDTPRNSVGTLDSYLTVFGNKGDRYRVYPDGRITNNDGSSITNKATLQLVYALYELNTNVFSPIKVFGDTSYYDFTLNGETYIIKTEKGKIVAKYSGDKYDKLIKELNDKVVDKEKISKAKKVLDTKDTLLDILTNGFNSSLYSTSMNGTESITVTDNSTKETVLTIPLELSDLASLQAFAGKILKGIDSGLILNPEDSIAMLNEFFTSLIRDKFSNPNINTSNKRNVLRSLTNNSDSTNNSQNPLDNTLKISIFANLNRTDKIALQKALKDKGISARTNEALESEVSKLLGMAIEELSKLSTEEIVSKINCK